MRHNRRAFRPAAPTLLEDRTAPSGLGGLSAAGHHHRLPPYEGAFAGRITSRGIGSGTIGVYSIGLLGNGQDRGAHHTRARGTLSQVAPVPSGEAPTTGTLTFSAHHRSYTIGLSGPSLMVAPGTTVPLHYVVLAGATGQGTADLTLAGSRYILTVQPGD